MEKEKILILCIDRDADIYEKLAIPGPIIGEKNVLNTAIKFALRDPKDSDVNALFEALRIYNEMKKKHDVEIAVLVGDRDRGINADRNISSQLEYVLSKFKANGVIFISDGVGDEFSIPIVQSRVKILSVQRVIVKQQESLEKYYYLIKTFLGKNSFILTLSIGVFLLAYGTLGQVAWRILAMVLGFLLILRALNLDEKFFNEIRNAKEWLFKNIREYRITFILLIISVTIFLYGLNISLKYFLSNFYIFLEIFSYTLLASSYLFLTGNVIDDILDKKSIKKHVPKYLYIASIFLVLFSISQYFLNEISLDYFYIIIIVSISIAIMSFVINKIVH